MIDQAVILQRAPAVRPWSETLTARLPGLVPVRAGDWLIRDEAYAGQMALRDALLANHRSEVFAACPGSEAAQRELFGLIVREVRASGAYMEEGEHLIRPDGIAVRASEPPPLVAAAKLVQEDLAILAPGPGGLVLVAAVIAFPASWRLSEKIGRPLSAIHGPVARLSAEMDARIEQVISRLPEDRIVQRANALVYNDPSLHQPRPELAPREFDPDAPAFLRVERQTLRALPDSGAVAFSIHTSVVPFSSLADEDRAGARRYLESIGAAAPDYPLD